MKKMKARTKLSMKSKTKNVRRALISELTVFNALH